MKPLIQADETDVAFTGRRVKTGTLRERRERFFDTSGSITLKTQPQTASKELTAKLRLWLNLRRSKKKRAMGYLCFLFVCECGKRGSEILGLMIPRLSEKN